MKVPVRIRLGLSRQGKGAEVTEKKAKDAEDCEGALSTFIR